MHNLREEQAISPTPPPPPTTLCIYSGSLGLTFLVVVESILTPAESPIMADVQQVGII